MIIGYYEQSSYGAIYYKLTKREEKNRFKLEFINSITPNYIPKAVKSLFKYDTLFVDSNSDFIGENKVSYFKPNPNTDDLLKYISKCNWKYVSKKEALKSDVATWYFYLEFNNQKYKINGSDNLPREILKTIKMVKNISNSNYFANTNMDNTNGYYSYINMDEAKILVIGDSVIKRDVLNSIAKEYGIPNDKIDFELDYLRLKKYNFKKLHNSLVYSDIMVGPIPHKVSGLDGYRSFIGRIKTTPSEYPKLTVLDSNSGLKITKESFKNGLRFTRLYEYIKNSNENCS